VRLVLVDDDTVIRQSLAAALGTLGFDVVGQAAGPAEALDVVAAHAPDVVLLDLQLADGEPAGGLDVATALRVRDGEVGVLVLSNHAYAAYLERLLALPGGTGVGYVLKSGSGGLRDLADAVRRVARGEVYVDAQLVRDLMRARRPSDDPVTLLTPAELAVLERMAGGRSNLRIAEELRIKLSTVERHISNLFVKLGLGPSDSSPAVNARVMAVLAYLQHIGRRPPSSPPPG
jgi:DNA-binding NarL/FixJ family response regulator